MSQLTRDQVIEVVGTYSDLMVTRIIETEATLEELMEAYTWLSEDDYMGREVRRPLSGRVAAVYDILKVAEPAEEERER
jgi:hypothetical protein